MLFDHRLFFARYLQLSHVFHGAMQFCTYHNARERVSKHSNACMTEILYILCSDISTALREVCVCVCAQAGGRGWGVNNLRKIVRHMCGTLWSGLCSVVQVALGRDLRIE